MKFSKTKSGLGLILSFFIAFGASAEPRTPVTTITQIRPYSSGIYFVQVATAALQDGTTCNRTYSVQTDAAGARPVIASILTAYALGQQIQIEVPTATGCEGFATPIESVFLRP